LPGKLSVIKKNPFSYDLLPSVYLQSFQAAVSHLSKHFNTIVWKQFMIRLYILSFVWRWNQYYLRWTQCC